MSDHSPVQAHSYDAIVFDAVGTLLEARPGVAQAYAQAAARQGIPLEIHTVRARFLAAFRQDEIHEQRGPLGTDEPTERRRWRRIVTQTLPELHDPSRAFDELWRHFGQPAAWFVHPDAADIVRSLLDAGIPAGVASNFDGRLRPVLAGHPPLDTLAHTAVISSEIGVRKPHPDFYRQTCLRLGFDPARTLWVGDDIQNDGRGPLESGLQAAIIDRENRLDVPPQLIRLRDLRDLTAYLRPQP